MERLKIWLLILTVFLNVHSIAGVCTTVDGVVETGEECDDGNTRSNDGCSDCMLDPIQLSLDPNANDEYSIEFFNLDEVVYLVDDPTLLQFSLTPTSLELTRIILVMLNDPNQITDRIDIFTAEALTEGRLSTDFTGFFQRSPLRASDPRLDGLDTFIDTSLISQGMIVTSDPDAQFFGGDADDTFSFADAMAVLLSAGYVANVHPGFDSREFCIIVTDDNTATTTTCLSLNFIGINDDPPIIMYQSDGVASFTEGQVDFVRIIDGTITITDPDHPRFLQMSAQAAIVDFIPNSQEVLSVTTENSAFTYNYDSNTGILTISGEATPEVYVTLLSDLTYLNSMSEPVGSERQVEISVNDGFFTSTPAVVMITIINTNDPPAISLNGEDPIVTELSISYTEGDGAMAIAPNAVVVDVDPDPMIQSVTVTLSNPIDTGVERLSLSSTNLMGISILPTDHMIRFSGVFPASVYTTVVRTVTYSHLGTTGNPTTGVDRLIEFRVQDSVGASSIQNSVVRLAIIPVNDAPILSFLDSNDVNRDFTVRVTTGDSSRMFEYLEDDSPLNFGRDIYLRDFDSSISSATLWLAGLFNGVNDVVSLNESLLMSHGINATYLDAEDGLSRVITLTGVASFGNYEEVLRTLTYRNIHNTNEVMDGNRVIRVSVNDTQPLTSDQIRATIAVGDRNDGPAVNLGAGEGVELGIVFEENGASVPIILPHLVSIMDEEGHNVSRLTVELRATNGELDEGDAIFFRSPLSLQFLDDFRIPPTTTLLDISLNGTTATYTDALLSIYYDNSEPEPTLFNSNGDRLIREVLIMIYDNNFLQDGQSNTADSIFDDNFGLGHTMARVVVTVDPVNDNRPRILIDAEPDGCGVSSTEEEGVVMGVTRRRRDVRAAGARMKRGIRGESSKAPMVTSVYSNFRSNCLDTITISFADDTNMPVVEVGTKLDAILSFDAPELSSALKFGVWMNPLTLVVVFRDCVLLEGGGVEGKERPLNVMFEAERGDCNWITPCSNSTICFQNNTGCPVSGSYRVNPAGPCEVGVNCEDPTEDNLEQYLDSYNVVTVTLLVLTFVTILLGLSLACRMTQLNSRSRTLKPKVKVIESTAIDNTPGKNEVIQVDEIGPQDFVVTLPPPPPPAYKPTISNPTSSVRSKDTHRQRKKAKRKVAKDTAISKEDEDPLLLQQDSPLGDEEEEGVVTLTPERSYDWSSEGSVRPQSAHTAEVGESPASESVVSSRELLANSGNPGELEVGGANTQESMAH